MNPRLNPVVIAHRGASGYRPEHTRSAYLLAIELGADALEPDLVASSDGVLVIRHENELSGTTDVTEHPEFADRYATKLINGKSTSGFFTEDFTWAELSTLRCRERLPAVRPVNAALDDSEPILRLRDLLGIVDEHPGMDVALMLELKHATNFADVGLPLDDLLANELSAAGWAHDDPRLTVESFEKTILGTLRERGIGARHFYILEFGYVAWDERKWAEAQGVPSLGNAEELSDAGLEVLGGFFDGISVDARYLVDILTGNVAAGKRLVEMAQNYGLEVFVWTLRPENTFLPAKWHGGLDVTSWGDWQGYYEAILSTGVDGVFADHPDLAIVARESVTPRP